MSLDTGGYPRSNSPASSDSSTPRPRIRGKEEPSKKDKNYRRYASTVERALSLFDNALQEWADYISFLSRLLKALQSHPPDLLVVPHKVLVAKRLAQCMNPALPSGVHQKALEVYTYIFGLIQADGLSHDLPLYFPGIAPTLTFASLSVRPIFLSLVDTYVTKLEPWAVRPALKAIILALLPGLEEETSEDFETTLRLTDKFRNIIADRHGTRGPSDEDTHGQYFWQCLFLASITNPSRRLGVLAYLNRYLPKLGVTERRTSSTETKTSEDAENHILLAADSVLLPEPGLLVRCFAAGLADEQLLVQRNFLELLVTHLPLSSPVLQSRITRDDLKRLVIAAVGVVTRRDMSLNRRLWAWLLGPEQGDEGIDRASSTAPGTASDNTSSAALVASDSSQSWYFSRFGLNPLLDGLLEMIRQRPVTPAEKTRPFRIALSLMDRWEVGGQVVPVVFLPIIESVQAYQTVASSSHFDEAFRSASSFFDGVESGVIFSELLDLIDWKADRLQKDASQAEHKLKLANFILENFNIREEDMMLIHAPLLTLALLVKMRELRTLTNLPAGPSHLIASEMRRAMNSLTGLLTEVAFTRRAALATAKSDERQLPQPDGPEILMTIREFYEQSKNSLELPAIPFPPEDLGELIIREIHGQVTSALRDRETVYPLHDQLLLLVNLLRKIPRSPILQDKVLHRAIFDRLKEDSSKPSTTSFSVISSVASTVASLYFMHTPGFHVNQDDIHQMVPLLVTQLWQYLSPLSPKFHVEAVRCLWLLHSISWSDHLIEASITSLMLATPSPDRIHACSEEQAENFFVLWNHSQHGSYEIPPKQAVDSERARPLYHSALLERPLWIVLDLLSQGPSKACHAVSRWLQNLKSMHKVFRILFARLDEFPMRSSRMEASPDTAISADDFRECNYLLRTLLNVISSLSPDGWTTFLSHSLTANTENEGPSSTEKAPEAKSFQLRTFQVLTAVISLEAKQEPHAAHEAQVLQQTALRTLQQLLNGPGSEELTESGLGGFLVDKLSLTIDSGDSIIQEAVIDTLLILFKVQFAAAYLPPPAPKLKHQRASSRDRLTSASLLSLTSDKADKTHPLRSWPPPPQQLLDCLLKGLSSQNSRGVLDKWMLLLQDALPLYSGAIFQILITLVECLCKQIQLSSANLQETFRAPENWPQDRSEYVMVALLGGLETCIGAAHERLLAEEVNIPAVKSPDQPQGFFGNMVSGVFTSDGHQGRTAAVNNRLTVLLCFQDAVRLCFSLWAWGSSERSGGRSEEVESLASFQYTSLRMRNRSRRILEHLFDAEALECLETLIELWTSSDSTTSALVLNLVNTLDGSRPKITVPAIFNAIYTRTNPTALDPHRKSAMTSNLTESELVGFLVTYTKTLDDDVLDEIWTDCMIFLRDVLSNPFPHRQILPRLVEFAAILGTKLENTTFGDDRRMRKDLGDALLRMLTAIFTSKPLGFSQDSSLAGRPSLDANGSSRSHIGSDDMLTILASCMPDLITALGESDRITTAVTGISTNITGPLIRSRLFPNNVNRNVLTLLREMSKVPAGTKTWKKDVGEALNDPRFFGSQIDLVRDGWMSLLRQLVLVDKDRLTDLLARLPPPSTAGIMFGVGASAARLEADRKAQLNLRRISLLIASAESDFFIGELPLLLQKLEDVLAATSASSPSSATRAEIYMVLRSLVVKSSANALAPFWPLINTELQTALSSVAPHQQSDLYNSWSLLQACKLLDVLLVVSPDEFQLSQWLFVTDTTDAVYPPDRWEPIALADEMSQSLGARGGGGAAAIDTIASEETARSTQRTRQPWLISDWIRETAKDEIVDKILRPFFDRLSIHAFESTYTMNPPDVQVCLDDLVADLFNESTMAQ